MKKILLGFRLQIFFPLEGVLQLQPTRLLKAFWIMFVIFPIANASSWSDGIIAALERKNPIATRDLILSHAPGCGFAVDYSDLEKSLSQHPEAAKSAAPFKREIQFMLNRQFSNACFFTYLTLTEDISRVTSARAGILQVLLDREGKLDEAKKASLANSLKELLGRETTPSEMKSQILVPIGKYSVSEDSRIFLRFANSEDTSLRRSAYQGLSVQIRANRRLGNAAANLPIFNALLEADSGSANLDQVKAIATISENYSRDYLMVNCAGSPARLAAIFYQDDNLTHPGILREALKLLSKSPTDSTLQKAIRFGTKDPGAAARELLSGSPQDKVAGEQLIALFPQLGEKKEADILSSAKPANGGSR